MDSEIKTKSNAQKSSISGQVAGNSRYRSVQKSPVSSSTRKTTHSKELFQYNKKTSLFLISMSYLLNKAFLFFSIQY